MTIMGALGDLLGLGGTPADYAMRGRSSSAFGYVDGTAERAYGDRQAGAGYGRPVHGTGQYRDGQGGALDAGGSGWCPTITYLHVLVLVELVAFWCLSRVLGVISGE